MLFITNANGDALNFIPSQVYQGSNEASEIIFLSPITAGVVECTFTLPDGTRTTPVILRALVEQGTFDVVKDGVTFQFRMWRAVLPRSVTQVAGAVQAQFTISNGTQTIATASFSFNVVFGAGQIRPDPPAQDVYEAIVEALGTADTRLDAVELLTGTLRTDLSNETAARESADAALGQRVGSVESGLTAEAAARQTADTALGNRIDDIEGDIDGKVDKIQAGTDYKVYGVQPANDGGAQTSIDATAFATNGNTIVMRDPNGRFYVKDPVYDAQPVNLRTQTAAIDAAKAEAKAYTDTRFSQFDLVVVVSELPTTGEENKLYLLTKENGEAGDLFEEYLWVNGAWELQGSASIDLSGYATTEALTEGLASLDADKLDKVTRTGLGNEAYCTNGVGGQVMIRVSVSDLENSIARRTSTGELAVGTPTEDDHATPKKYVDDGLDGKVGKIENTDTYYDFAYLTKANNGGTIILKVDTGNQGYTIAKRTSLGALAVSTPTAANHATPRSYVDEKCIVHSILLESEAWVERPVSGPPGEDDAWSINLSDVGIKDNPKFIAWTFHTDGIASVPTGFESANGTNAFPNAQPSYNGAKVQIAEGELIILGATSPSSTSFGVRYMNLVVFY